jgi:large conductance mechanosensitive channel
MLKEFKEFVISGNAISLAIGLLVGGFFQNIITSFVNNFINPIIGLVSGGADFSSKYLPLNHQTEIANALTKLKETAPDTEVLPIADARKVAAVIGYGDFITTLINVLITAAIVFLIVKVLNKLKKDEPIAPPSTTESLLTEIRDSLKAGANK